MRFSPVNWPGLNLKLSACNPYEVTNAKSIFDAETETNIGKTVFTNYVGFHWPSFLRTIIPGRSGTGGGKTATAATDPGLFLSEQGSEP